MHFSQNEMKRAVELLLLFSKRKSLKINQIRITLLGIFSIHVKHVEADSVDFLHFTYFNLFFCHFLTFNRL